MDLNLEPYRVKPGESFSLSRIDPSDTQNHPGKEEAKAQRKANIERIADLQERLYAESEQSVLLVLQAMDAGGKDSTIEAVTRGVNPQGCTVSSFKGPSKKELAHDFLWRVHAEVPEQGHITIFNRSHYEDVLIVRVNGWAPPELIEKRYGHINDFERLLTDHGTHIVKVMLHISKDYQLSRFRRRLERPDKWWKFNPDDMKTRAKWDAYMEAFEMALSRCSTEYAPWYVIPAEHKWFRTLAVSQLLRETLERIDPQYPPPEFDPEEWTLERLDREA